MNVILGIKRGRRGQSCCSHRRIARPGCAVCRYKLTILRPRRAWIARQTGLRNADVWELTDAGRRAPQRFCCARATSVGQDTRGAAETHRRRLPLRPMARAAGSANRWMSPEHAAWSPGSPFGSEFELPCLGNGADTKTQAGVKVNLAGHRDAVLRIDRDRAELPTCSDSPRSAATASHRGLIRQPAVVGNRHTRRQAPTRIGRWAASA